MSGDKRRFLKAEAQVLQQLRDVEDIREDAKAIINHLLDHGRTPAGAAETGFAWPLLNELGQGFFLRWGQFGRAACRLVVGAPWSP
jgi:hypothetical protein